MNPAIVAAVLAALPVHYAAPVSVACHVSDGSGAFIMRTAQLYTGRHDRRFAVGGKLFLDMRYDALKGTVAVTVVQAPHAPWSFGEKVLEPEQVFDIRDEQGGVAIPSITSAARLQCGAS